MACQKVHESSLAVDNWIEFPLQFSNWELPSRFINVKAIGSGAFGSVCSAFDIKSKRTVAIKRCTMIFLYHDKALSVYRELSILFRLKNDRIIKLFDAMIPPSSTTDKSDSLTSLYLVMEFSGTNLDQVMKSLNLDDFQLCSILGQILQGLMFIHSAGIVHRDIKTHNILINDSGRLAIINFGLACKIEEVSLGYVSTWWNTAPEILLSFQADMKVDIWSVGCVLAELMTGSPLFTTTDKCNLLKRMGELLNIAHWDWIDRITDERLYETAQSSKELVTSRGLAEMISASNEYLFSCLEMLLQFDSNQRPSAEEALKHSLFNFQQISHDKYTDASCPVLDHDTIMQSQNSIQYLRELIMENVELIQSNWT